MLVQPGSPVVAPASLSRDVDPVLPSGTAPSVQEAPRDQATLGESAPPPPVSPMPRPPVSPFPVLLGISRYVYDFNNAKEEPADMRGMVFEQYPDGTSKILRHSGETLPDAPAGGPSEIPADAVKGNRVVVYVDGLHQSLAEQQHQVRDLLQAPRQNPQHGASVDQPVIAVHEGVRASVGGEVWRAALSVMYLKMLQSKMLPLSWVNRKIYHVDPAAKAVHDVVRQSLQAGHDVQLAVHSGGGILVALALNILGREDGGKYRDLIRDHVRVMGAAPGVAFKDFVTAGIKPENIYYTGSRLDPVWSFCHNYAEPVAQFMNMYILPDAIEAGRMLKQAGGVPPTHSPDYIWWRNVQADGSQRIQPFLDGGPGGNYTLT